MISRKIFCTAGDLQRLSHLRGLRLLEEDIVRHGDMLLVAFSLANPLSRLFDVVISVVVIVVAAADVVGHNDRGDVEAGHGRGSCFFFGCCGRNFSRPLKSFPIFWSTGLPDHVRRQGQS